MNHTEKRPCKDTARSQSSASQGQRPQKKPNLQISWSSRLQNCEKINACHFSHRVDGILLWEPLETNTDSVILNFCHTSLPHVSQNAQHTMWAAPNHISFIYFLIF